VFLAASGFGIGVLLGVAWGLMWPRGPVTGTPPTRRAQPRQPGADAVLTCPGPVAPRYACVGGRGALCPLVLAAEVVVLSLELASDTALAGTPALQLLCYYLGLGKGVVALGRPGDSVSPFEQERVLLIGRPAERRALLGAVAHQVIGGVGTGRSRRSWACRRPRCGAGCAGSPSALSWSAATSP